MIGIQFGAGSTYKLQSLALILSRSVVYCALSGGGQFPEYLKMVVRLGAAICVAAFLSCSSSSITQAGIQNHSTLDAAASGPTITGAATTYNPYRPGYRSGGTKTASGEPYDPSAWTGAIQTDLRGMFGGVHFGKDYRPAYALVASADKQVIIKINDVGPLEPGRVIDLNEQTMRYFDPTLERGVIRFIHVTPLLGDDWPPGPIAGDPVVEAGAWVPRPAADRA